MLYRPNILFDFDGTLFDTAPGILHCMRDALTACGYDPGDDAALRRFVGPPVLEALREFYGMDEAEAERVKTLYRTAYRAEGVYECAPIAGAEECLRALKAAGAHIAVATSKPIRFAREILQRFRFDGYFDAVCGAEDDAHAGKAEIVARALSRLNAAPADAVMVGGPQLRRPRRGGVRRALHRHPHRLRRGWRARRGGRRRRRLRFCLSAGAFARPLRAARAAAAWVVHFAQPLFYNVFVLLIIFRNIVNILQNLCEKYTNQDFYKKFTKKIA